MPRLALLAALRRPRRGDLLLAWPIAAFAMTIMLLGDADAAFRYGWYRFAIYPLVYLVAADFVPGMVGNGANFTGSKVAYFPASTAITTKPARIAAAGKPRVAGWYR